MADRVPRLVAHVDVRKFKLDPMDGFLLTRVDGRLGPKDLARETGLADFSVTRALEKLEKLGVIEMIDPSAPPPPREPPPPPRERGQLPEFASIGLEPKYDPKELEEEVDLSADQKKRILDLYYRLDDLDHYTLLGVPKTADKKTVKRSYFELAAMTHPDRFFKKNLGSFKPKMEALFGRITEAHDTLIDPERRTDYDAYLDEVATTRGMEAMLERALEESRKAQAAQVVEPAPVSVRNGVVATVPPPSVRAPTGPSPEEIAARKQALAKRLLGGSGSIRPPMGSRPEPPPAPDPLRYTNPQDAMDALKRRYEERIDNATMAQAKKYLVSAEEALAKNDVVAAASALQIAVQFAPEDGEIAFRYQEVKNQADKLLCESYQKQAIYEERAQHWAEAARSWQKVAKIKVTDAKAHGHAAYCLLQMDGADLHQASEHAKSAVTNDSSNVQYHVTLAEIYLKAGKHASAKRSAETGLQLDPKNAQLLAVVKKAGK
ncbi:MAG: DnaJ domain-containing protein [Deltaproteobacteria bacterium]|nr:DnaJ domain-containing protein [Deltaproteobacteria bacterium]